MINMPLGEEITMTGPMGKRNYAYNDKLLAYTFLDEERMIFLIAGSGILRFLDFFFSLYIKVCQEALSNTDIKKKLDDSDEIELLTRVINDNMESPDQSYVDLRFNNEEIPKPLQIEVALSFKTSSDFFGLGLDFFYDFQRLSAYSKFIKFRFTLAMTEDSAKLPNSITGRINREAISSLLSINPEKIYVCGPSEFKEGMFKHLIYFGVPQKGIYMI